jgi:hypothetical protein
VCMRRVGGACFHFEQAIDRVIGGLEKKDKVCAAVGVGSGWGRRGVLLCVCWSPAVCVLESCCVRVLERCCSQLWGMRALELANVEPADSWSVCFACLHQMATRFGLFVLHQAK